MPAAVPTKLPETTLLAQLRATGSYADCFSLSIPRVVTQAAFVEAFYTTALFKSERLLLSILAGKSSTDRQALELACGTRNSFAVWSVTQRTEKELLLTDQTGRTSSWLMASPEAFNGRPSTRLFFGSAIKPKRNPSPGEEPQFSRLFHALLGLHKLYSQKLLEAAATRVANAAGEHALSDASQETPSK